MNQSLFSAMLPALGLLLLMGLLAWGVHWLKKRIAPVGSGQGAQLRQVAQLMVGPQQRVVVVEVNGPNGPVQLTLGVTPQHISALHMQPVAALPESESDTLAAPAFPAAPSPGQTPETLYQKVARSLASQTARAQAPGHTPGQTPEQRP